MTTFSSFSEFINNVCSELGYEHHLVDTESPYFTTVIVRKSSEGFVISWEIKNDLLYNGAIDEIKSESLKTLFYNKKLFPPAARVDAQYIEDFISLEFVDKTPDNKILSLLEYIRLQMTFDGDSVDLIDSETPLSDQFWRRLYFNSLREFEFYMETIYELGYVKYEHGQGYYLGIKLTIDGLKQVLRLVSEKSSRTCFIAMSFEEEMFKIYESAIKPAIIETGFEPLIISEKRDIPSDTTINDAILAGIKKSKFTIADFTNHKHGVYFESGYALGRGQKVIYTCRADEIGKAHFDTRNYPHIVWKDADDLRRQLIDKIEVFIKG